MQSGICKAVPAVYVFSTPPAVYVEEIYLDTENYGGINLDAGNYREILLDVENYEKIDLDSENYWAIDPDA